MQNLLYWTPVLHTVKPTFLARRAVLIKDTSYVVLAVILTKLDVDCLSQQSD